MNKKLFNVLMFTAGAAIGSLVTWKVVKTRYERILQEEIDSVKETWTRLSGGEQPDTDDHDDETVETDIGEDESNGPDEATMTDYAAIAGRYGKPSGDDTDTDGKGEGGGDASYVEEPYVIPPEEFGNGDFDHTLYCLTYYADGILANDWWEVLDVEYTIGQESLNHFSEYAEDVVHVRNERLGADYEVVRDWRTFAEVVATNPLASAYAT